MTDYDNSIIVHYICFDVPADTGGSQYVQTFKFANVIDYQSWVEATPQ